MKYKLYILSEKGVKEIIVFFGFYHERIDYLVQKFKNPYDPVFKINYNNSEQFEDSPYIFTEEELTEINDNKIKVSFVDYLINMDDNIHNLKDKVFLVKNEYPVEEMYFMEKNSLGFTTLGLTIQTFQPNPFNVTDRVPFVLSVNNKCITHTKNNVIYLCYAEDVINAKKDYEPYILENYYPYSLGLDKRRENLRENNETIPNLESFYRSGDMFFDVYQNRTKDLNYIQPFFGFKHLDFMIKSEKNPIQSIFNISHSTQKIPLIKLNVLKGPKVFRLFTNKVSTDGRKIPYLPSSAITKVNNLINKTFSVSFFVNETDYMFLCQVVENGFRIYMEFPKFVDESKVIECFHEGMTEVFSPIESFLKRARVQIPSISHLNQVDIINLEYQTKLRESIFDIQAFRKCISTIFVIERDDPTIISLRYKKVSGFNVENSKEAFIMNNVKNNVGQRKIIEGLIENYQLSGQSASSFYNNFVTQLKSRDKVKKKLYKINSPGVLINIEINKRENNITIKSNEITNINMIQPLFIILDTIMRIKYKNYTNFPIQNINAVCDIKAKEPLYKPVIENEIEEKEIDEDAEEIEEEEPEEMEARVKEKDENLLRFFDDSDDDSDESQSGGGTEASRRSLLKNRQHVLGLNGKSLNNIFKKRMEDYDNSLFINDKPEGKYKGYSSSCQSNVRRQPVILNKTELDGIQTTHPDMLGKKDILEYKTEDGEDLFFICPRYWCLLDQSVMTKEEVESGQCGKVIPHNVNEVPDGHYVYEFFHPKEHGTQEKYQKHGPGISTNQHKKTCLPCCFKKWDTPRQIQQINECKNKGFILENQPDNKNDENDSLSVEPQEKVDKERKKHQDIIVRSPEKFPLDEYTWGYLPPTVELFFGEFNIDCQISRTNTELKPNNTCIMRHGIKHSKNKSFIACISDIKNMYSHNGKLIEEDAHTVENLIQDMIDVLSLDVFISLQNGSLIETFASPREIDIAEYRDTTIYKKLFKDAPGETSEEYTFFNIICSSYENYLDFLKNKDSFIDYTYTWDLVSRPNYIFKNGVNLIILEIIEDVTNKIELICPTNHYSSEFYDVNKKCVIILKKDEYFEPLYLYKSTKQYKSEATAYFDTKRNSTLSQKFKDVLTKIVKHRLQTCNPLPSLPRIYTFSHPILLTKLIHYLKLKNHQILNQVVNLNGKVVGLSVKRTGVIGYVPCFPSAIIPYSETYPYEYVFANDFKWNTYRNTMSFLNNLHDTEKNIECNVELQVIEDQHVVGLLTKTNQFVQIDPPLPITEMDDIPFINSYNYNEVDSARFQGEDQERVDYVANIKKESDLENTFFSFFVYLLNEPENSMQLEELTKLNANRFLLDKLKEDAIYKMLKEMSTNISFTDDFTDENYENTQNCFDSKCELVFPRENLVTGERNEMKYYKKIISYLTRYQPIKQNIHNAYLFFNSTKLLIYDNELYIFQSMLKDYFEDLIPMITNETYKDYDNVEPLLKTDYDNTVDFEKMLKPSQMVFETKIENIHTMKWKHCFPKEFKEAFFTTQSQPDDYEKNKMLVSCTYEFALHIINEKMKLTGEEKRFTESDITKILYDEYIVNQMFLYIKQFYDVESVKDIIDVRNNPPVKEKYMREFDEYFDKIVDLLRNEGKNGLIKIQTQKKIHNQAVVNNLINDDNYFLSIIDLWILFLKFNISFVFISSFVIRNVEESYKYKFVGNISDDNIVFIVAPGLTDNKVPIFKFITKSPETLNVFISQSDLKCRMIEEPLNFTEFLENYKIVSKKEYVKQKPKRFVIPGNI